MTWVRVRRGSGDPGFTVVDGQSALEALFAGR